MLSLQISSSQPKQVLDITDQLQRLIKKQNFQSGLCTAFAAHTTCALTTADLDPGTDLDMLDAFDALIPKLKFRHPHDPSHTPDHILSSLIGSSVTVPVKDGQLILGTWQRVVLIDFNGPRDRLVIVNLIPSS
jgi:secondary thiamine-phosphate synthase enzyme